MSKRTITKTTKTIEQCIDEQEVWTFSDCLGLSADYGTKVRMVIVMVYARGKTYVERDLKEQSTPDS